MSAVTPYSISIPQAKVDRLKQKLALADFPDELNSANWDYGCPLDDIKRLAGYWQNGYDWRRAEEMLNRRMPQFTAEIQVEGFEKLRVHFVHQRSDVEGAVPLLFVHGWPGHFDEVSKILQPLVAGGADYPSFHVVAPSLPNFGFSEGTKKRGWTSRQHAEACHKLMQTLGYEEYVTQGGDVGYSVTRGMGYLYPHACKASHVNMPLPNPPTIADHPDLFFESQQHTLTESEKAGLARTDWFRKEGFGYNLEQSTKPQTLGYSVADSPVGLLAWIYEKLHDWSDDYPWTDDEILTWVSIYWFSTAGPAASMRIYYESTHDEDKFSTKLRGYIDGVQLGIAKFPKELFHMPKLWHKTLGPVVFESEYTSGGHFAAFERPDVVVDDLRRMFGKGGGAYAAVRGRTGYDD